MITLPKVYSVPLHRLINGNPALGAIRYVDQSAVRMEWQGNTLVVPMQRQRGLIVELGVERLPWEPWDNFTKNDWWVSVGGGASAGIDAGLLLLTADGPDTGFASIHMYSGSPTGLSGVTGIQVAWEMFNASGGGQVHVNLVQQSPRIDWCVVYHGELFPGQKNDEWETVHGGHYYKATDQLGLGWLELPEPVGELSWVMVRVAGFSEGSGFEGAMRKIDFRQ